MATARAWHHCGHAHYDLFALHLGRRFTRPLLFPTVFFYWLTSAKTRRASSEFLSLALSRPARPVDTLKHIFYFANTILDRVFVLSGKSKSLDITYTHKGDFDDIRKHSGGIFITSHIGSFEIMRALGKEARNLRIKLLMDYKHGARIGALLKQLNPDFMQHIIDVGNSDVDLMLKIKAAIDDGYMVAIMADRVSERDTPIICDFFDKKIELPISPWQLAVMLKVPVALCFGLYRGGNRYDLKFDRIETQSVTSRQQRKLLAENYAQQYAQRLEHYAKQAPYNWFNFYTFWLPPKQTSNDTKKQN